MKKLRLRLKNKKQKVVEVGEKVDFIVSGLEPNSKYLLLVDMNLGEGSSEVKPHKKNTKE